MVWLVELVVWLAAVRLIRLRVFAIRLAFLLSTTMEAGLDELEPIVEWDGTFDEVRAAFECMFEFAFKWTLERVELFVTLLLLWWPVGPPAFTLRLHLTTELPLSFTGRFRSFLALLFG